jgi:hypothetical protein
VTCKGRQRVQTKVPPARSCVNDPGMRRRAVTSAQEAATSPIVGRSRIRSTGGTTLSERRCDTGQSVRIASTHELPRLTQAGASPITTEAHVRRRFCNDVEPRARQPLSDERRTPRDEIESTHLNNRIDDPHSPRPVPRLKYERESPSWRRRCVGQEAEIDPTCASAPTATTALNGICPSPHDDDCPAGSTSPHVPRTAVVEGSRGDERLTLRIRSRAVPRFLERCLGSPRDRQKNEDAGR